MLIDMHTYCDNKHISSHASDLNYKATTDWVCIFGIDLHNYFQHQMY